MIIEKLYLGISLQLLRAVWGQLVSDRSFFQLVLVLKVYRPFQCLVNDNYRILICCTCHFHNSSLFSNFASLLQVSSVSNLHPDTRG